ncbi:MAG: hypothetical protein LW721_17230 [Flammeovirgaceae bacterium]|nr:hypothetical protein [Flammeovirgaceae bacterium]
MYHQIKSSYHLGLDYKDGKPTRYVDKVYLDYPVFFFDNGLMAYNEHIYIDSAGFNRDMSYARSQQDVYTNDWGVYEIKEDTIKATLYCSFSYVKGIYGTRRLLCNFEGIIHNRDTIYQWKLVPPYPDVIEAANRDVDVLKTARDLYFKSVPIKQLINPEMAWINEFKNESGQSRKREK